MHISLAEKNPWMIAYADITVVFSMFRHPHVRGDLIDQLQKILLTAAYVLLIFLSPLLDISALYDASTAQEAPSLAQPRLAIPLESALGEMTVYRGGHLNHSYHFIMDKLWNNDTRTEFVRIDFQLAINFEPDSSPLSAHPHLRKRPADRTSTEWLYVPAWHRVRIIPYRSVDPLLRSASFFYDLAAVCDLSTRYYQFIEANGQAPTDDGRPGTASVPYQKILFVLEHRGSRYVLRAMKSLEADKERRVVFFDFQEIAPGRYRPQKLVVSSDEGRTEITFRQWQLGATTPMRFPLTHLEMLLLQKPEEMAR
jgi:hypothetical protein